MEVKTLFILCFSLAIIGSLSYNYYQDNYNEHKVCLRDDFCMNAKDYKAITDPLPEGLNQICDIEQKKCELIIKGGLD